MHSMRITSAFRESSSWGTRLRASFCTNEMREPNWWCRAHCSATEIRSADFSHATTWSADSGRAPAATMDRVPTPAPTWITSTPLVDGYEKMAFRVAAA